MRILHTSDWHLGQHFMGKSREAEHRSFIQWLLCTVRDQCVDALIIAGDIFDTGTPPSYARTMYNQFIVDLQKTCCRQLIIVGGNHDSVATLNESRQLLACLNTSVIGGVAENPEDQVITLKNNNNEPGAIVCAIPFIRPREVLESRAGDSGTDKQQALQTAISDHYKTLFELARKRAGATLPIIATGHLTTVGGQVSESEREIYIGSLSAFPVNAFPDANYIALGHLHRGQMVSKQQHIRYSGSPIPLSFGETSKAKQILLVDFDGAKLKQVISVEVPRFRKLLILKGSLEQIEKQLGDLPEDDDLQPWLDIEVETDDYLTDLQNRVEQLVEGGPAILLRVRKNREKSAHTLITENRETLAELKVDDVFIQRLQQEEMSEDKQAMLTQAFREIVISVKEDETSQTMEVR